MKKIFLCSPRGFCAGVERAIQTVEKALKLWGPPIYVKHEIVHNQHVVDSLKEKGAVFIEDIQKVPKGSRIIYSAHGVSPEVRKEAKARGLIEIDATCGLVTKVHSAAKRFAFKGYFILLIGHKNHVETIGTFGEAPEVTTIIENVEDVKKLSFSKEDKLCYLTQTTLSLDEVKEIVEELEKRFPQIETLPSSSICYATTNRQRALISVLDKIDSVIVVGDVTSSNSNRLKEIAQKRKIPSYLVHSEKEIDPDFFKTVNTVAITAGASTPEEYVKRCIDFLGTLGFQEIEEVFFTEENITFSLPSLVNIGTSRI